MKYISVYFCDGVIVKVQEKFLVRDDESNPLEGEGKQIYVSCIFQEITFLYKQGRHAPCSCHETIKG